ncbi:type II secretion system protein GspM [Azohydromonas caseinilytica]|uniref:Type II secretion system protein M n=1 Tax=Azohydromonas caseinilytica TaxID=2728836 RepID=A0A848F241_9BURK|nr:type II secretion system protein GspM [Azohydromonas caseinilytica]NML13472.1 type II secretion system protein M [Azohydromonas caseinilytica]
MNAVATREQLTQRLTVWRDKLRARWRALAPRERRLLSVAGALLGVLLLWLLAVQPAWRTLREAPVEIDRLEAQLQRMQRQAAEVRELRATPPVPAAQGVEALRSATQRLGERAKLTVAGDRATVTLTGVEGEQLRDWLAEVRNGARARPVEMQLTRAGQGFSGNVVLALGGTP